MNRIISKNNKYRSIRSILIVWFFVFSIIPLVFMGWYFLFKFEAALQGEVVQRLKNNGREIETMISDYYSDLFEVRDSYLSRPTFTKAIESKNFEELKSYGLAWLQKSAAVGVSFYDKAGLLLLSTTQDTKKNIRYFNLNNERILLNERYLKFLDNQNEIAFVDNTRDRLTLILFSKISSEKQQIGYVEQTVELSDEFLRRIKGKLRLEGFLMSENQSILSASKPIYKKINNKFVNITSDKLIELDHQNQRYGFIVYPIQWGRSKFYIGLGSISEDSQALISNVQIAFISVLSVVVFLLILTILLTTDWFLKPVNRLISGLKQFDTSEQLLLLPVENRTEVGLLTQAFNEMSYKIYQTRADLKKKIKELELANQELKEAQTKLVHSAKMTSLGQLVAGVAHELNNPIGFIFSNTKHLKDYADQLFDLIDTVEKNPDQMDVKKTEIEYDYIKKDLPRLIKSCQDGAQRTRDIVLGLRNFSRLEEAQLKEIDIKESLSTTLELLSGEIKNRIQINTQFDPLPKVLCFASQINQVFMNILSNAVQAVHGQGQIWITASAMRASEGQVGRVLVSIQDSGEGMDPETLEKIFEPFFTTKGIGQGTGLGLSISYGIIQNHGGEIQVRSQKGLGTEFRIIIPVRPPEIK